MSNYNLIPSPSAPPCAAHFTGQVRMVRSCKNDNVKCDGLAMVARGISSDNG